MIEWEATGIVLGASPFGEADAVVNVLTEAHGAHRGLVRGGVGARRRADWQVGNVLKLRWRGRLPDQLGTFDGELAAAPHARLLDAPLALATLAAGCAVARDALPERGEVPVTFGGLLLLLARLGGEGYPVPELVRWERALLAELGFGLDLERCAVTGATGPLAFVSPRTGRAVVASAARGLEARLLPLPGFLDDAGRDADQPSAWLDGLALTGHFLARDVFGWQHRGLPAPRVRLADLVRRLAEVERDGVGPGGGREGGVPAFDEAAGLEDG